MGGASTAGYSYRLTPDEVDRYDRMAAAAERAEGGAWWAAGIRPGARVVDLGCGPGALIPRLVRHVRPGGGAVGVDRAPEAVAAARALVVHHGLTAEASVAEAPCEATGLRPGSVDVALIRNVLVHNGPASEEILAHARSLLSAGGRLLVVEPDGGAIGLPDDAPEERELEERWCAWARSVGNDPAIGARLVDVVAAAGFVPELVEHRVDHLEVAASPAATARDALRSSGFADDADLARWDAAIARRLATRRPLAVALPVYLVVARPTRS